MLIMYYIWLVLSSELLFLKLIMDSLLLMSSSHVLCSKLIMDFHPPMLSLFFIKTDHGFSSTNGDFLYHVFGKFLVDFSLPLLSMMSVHFIDLFVGFINRVCSHCCCSQSAGWSCMITIDDDNCSWPSVSLDIESSINSTLVNMPCSVQTGNRAFVVSDLPQFVSPRRVRTSWCCS